jgi:hypothetical protein
LRRSAKPDLSAAERSCGRSWSISNLTLLTPALLETDYILVIRPPPGAVVSLREPSGALELGDAPLPLDRVTEHPQHLGEGAALLDRLPWRAVRLDSDRRPLRWGERLARYAPAGEAVTLSGARNVPYANPGAVAFLLDEATRRWSAGTSPSSCAEAR